MSLAGPCRRGAGRVAAWRRINVASAGLSVSEQKHESAVATAMVTANWRKKRPVMPSRKAVGTNTAQSTSAMDSSAPPTSSMVAVAARWTDGSVRRWRSTFSTTTMASSTTIPTASTRPNRVRTFKVKPKASITPKVPIRDTGMARMGMSAARQFCRNSSTTSTTRTPPRRSSSPGRGRSRTRSASGRRRSPP